MSLHDSFKKRANTIAAFSFVFVLLLMFTVTNTVVAAGSEIGESDLIGRVAELISSGQFVQAEELIAQTEIDSKVSDSVLSKVNAIVSKYKDIEKERQATKAASYQEQIERIEKFKTGVDSVTDANDPNDPNTIDLDDPNDIRLVLSVIAKAREYANEEQREKLLSDKYVVDVIQKSIDKAADFETHGKWVEAYANCYGWLAAIDPNKEAYSDYAEQLLDKAEIAASFEDSPCETSEERYRGVKKDMFTLAVYALSMDYVESPEYRQMADKALERCKLLAEVLSNQHRFVPAAASDSNESGAVWFTPPDKQRLAAWISTVAAVRDEIHQSPAEFGRKDLLGAYEKIIALNKATAQIPEQILITQFAQGAFGALDKYTSMVWPQQVQEFEKNMMNEFTGIGVEISKRTGLLTVASLLPDTPAYKAGLDAGDVIEAVDGIKTKDMSLPCAVRKITGPKGTKVTLTVKRAVGGETKEMVITRDKIIIPSLRGWQRSSEGKWLYMIDDKDKIGYVRITSFASETSDNLETILEELESQGMKGLILDVRANPGGLLSSAVAIVDKFVEDGLIVRTQPRSGFRRWPSYETAKKKDTHPNYPLVVLIDSSSASGSEILAGALADKKYKRAILVGERTHGKGSVQTMTGYTGGGSQLKYTMAYYHLPSDQRVLSREEAEKRGTKDWGVGPDVEVKLRSDELRKLIDIQRDNDVLMQADNGDVVHENNRHTLEETIEADPQLAVALLVVKSNLYQDEAVHLAGKN